MRLNYFKAAEQDIASLPTLKRSIEFLEKKRQHLVDSGKPSEPGAIDYSKPYTDSHFVNDTLNELLSVAECTAEIKETKAEIQHIESILSELQKEHRKVLTMFYINKLPADKIAEAIYVESDKTVYNIRNKALAQYALLSYGVRAKTADNRR